MAVGNDAECLKLERYRNYLLLLARMQLTRRSGAKFDASDLVQATLLKAHAQRHQFRGQSDGEVQAWLRCILAGTLADVFGASTGASDVARSAAWKRPWNNPRASCCDGWQDLPCRPVRRPCVTNSCWIW